MSIRDNLYKIQSELPEDVKLIVVSKNKSVQIIKEAYDAGQRLFAENYVQEFLGKYNSPELKELDIEWHFIGNLQRNKVKYIIDKISLIQSVSSVRLAEEINKRAFDISKVQDVLVEINIGEEKNKGGAQLEEFYKVIDKIRSSSNLKLKGLMVIPPLTEDVVLTRRYFEKVRKIFDEIGNLHRDTFPSFHDDRWGARRRWRSP